jgi:hypothetical protein
MGYKASKPSGLKVQTHFLPPPPPLKQSCSDRDPWKSVTTSEARKAFLKELHELKTDIFNELVETGRLPLRPGVKRLVGAPESSYFLCVF